MKRLENKGSLGSRVKLLMDRTNTSKEDLVRSSKIRLVTLNDLISNKRVPHYKTLVRISKVLGKSVLWLREGIEHVDNLKRSNVYVEEVVKRNLHETLSPMNKSVGLRYFGLGGYELTSIDKLPEVTKLDMESVMLCIEDFIKGCEDIYRENVGELSKLKLNEERHISVKDISERYNIILPGQKYSIIDNEEEEDKDLIDLENMSYLEIVSINLNNYLEKEGYSYNSFSKEVNLSHVTVSRLAKAKDGRIPTNKTLSKVADYIGVSLKDFRSKLIDFDKDMEEDSNTNYDRDDESIHHTLTEDYDQELDQEKSSTEVDDLRTRLESLLDSISDIDDEKLDITIEELEHLNRVLEQRREVLNNLDKEIDRLLKKSSYKAFKKLNKLINLKMKILK